MKKSLIQWFSLTGVLAFVLYLAASFIAPLYYPGYQWTEQAVSDLSALTSPSLVPWLVIWTFGSACALLSSAAVCVMFQQKGTKLLRLGVYLFAVMTWLSLGYTMFPLSEGGNAGTPIDIAHIWVVTPLVTVTTVAALTLLVIGGLKSKQYKTLGLFAGATLCFVCVGAVGIGLAGAELFGLFERFTVYSIMAFTAVLGVYGFRESSSVLT